MSQRNARKPIKSRLGHRRTLSNANCTISEIRSFNETLSLAGSSRGIGPPAPSNLKSGVNKCLFGNNGNDHTFQDSRYELFPTERPHFRLSESVQNNVDNGKSFMQYRETTRWVPSNNHPFATPGGNGDAFPDVETREKDENDVWSAFKTKKPTVKNRVSSGKRNCNLLNNTNQEQIRKNGESNGASETRAPFHRLLQYKSGVLQSPKAPQRVFSYRQMKIEEPKPPTPSRAFGDYIRSKQDEGDGVSRTRAVIEDRSPRQNDRTVSSEDDSTNSFIANESSMAEFNTSGSNPFVGCCSKPKLSTIPEQDSLEKARPAGPRIIENDVEALTANALLDEEDPDRRVDESSDRIEPSSGDNSAAFANSIVKSTPASIVKNSGVISTKIRRSGGRRSIHFTPGRAAKARSKTNCADESIGDSNPSGDVRVDESEFIQDIRRRKEKLDGLLNSYLREKEMFDSWLLAAVEEKCRGATASSGGSKTPDLEKTLTTSSSSPDGRNQVSAGKKMILMLPRGTPVGDASYDRRQASWTGRHHQQYYAALRASYSFLRTPVNSQKKQGKRETCYTPHSLSMCVDEQMKDIFGD